MIERVGSADLDDLLPLMRGYCDFYEVAPSDDELRSLCQALIADPDSAGLQLIARDDAYRTPLGFATIFWSYSTLSATRIAIMNDLYVAPGARRGGVGAALIRACEAECASRDVAILEWQTAHSNTRAQSVYDTFAAAQRSEWLTYTLPVTRR
ncbi:MAG TPA: GNAT family N-acetyltransferase [Solirubrobacteraceae bacterium]|nr:GNAT family N-acetyltransferase [Solirubrobacteraceae bacterium]